jgi:hypothetical protein
MIVRERRIRRTLGFFNRVLVMRSLTQFSTPMRETAKRRLLQRFHQLRTRIPSVHSQRREPLHGRQMPP